MAIINQRWPRELAPETCQFARTRNDIPQVSPRTRQRTVIRQGRPLWTAQLSWSLPNNARLAYLRYLLEALDGFVGSVQLWDFGASLPGELSYAFGAGSETIPWSYSGTNVFWSFGGVGCFWSYFPPVMIASAALAGTYSVQVSGLTANALVCVQGQYFQIGRRLYVAAQAVMSDASGNATIYSTTPLLSAVTSSDTVRFVDPACEMQLAEQDWNENERAGDGLIVVSATFVESVTDVTA